MSKNVTAAILDALVALDDKKRITRNEGIIELVKNMHKCEDINEVMPRIVSSLNGAFSRGCNYNGLAIAVSQIAIIEPDSNALGPLAQNYLKFFIHPKSPVDSRAELAIGLGWLSAMVGNYSKIYETLPFVILDKLMDFLEECIAKHENWDIIQNILFGLTIGCLGLAPGSVGGWVYSRLMTVLGAVVCYYNESYDSVIDERMKGAYASPLLHLLTILVSSKQQVEELEVEAVYLTPNLFKHSNPGDVTVDVIDAYSNDVDVEDDDEYFYSLDDIVVNTGVRLSFEGFRAKLESLSKQEIETDVEVKSVELDKFITYFDVMVENGPVLEKNNDVIVTVAAHKDDVEKYINDWYTRSVYYSVYYSFTKFFGSIDPFNELYSVASFISRNTYLSSLLLVDINDDDDIDHRCKNPEFLRARRLRNKRKGQIENQERYEKYKQLYTCEDEQ